MIRGLILAGLILLSGQTVNTGHHRMKIGTSLNACTVSAYPMNEGTGIDLC